MSRLRSYPEMGLSMEILKRSKKATDGEIVAWNENPKSIQEEVLRRACKAGYCSSTGEQPYRSRIMDNGFGESKLNVWPRDEQGNLIGD